MRAWGLARWCLGILLVIAGLGTAWPQQRVQASSASLSWPDGSSFAALGPNGSITISGSMDFINVCGPLGIPDQIVPSMDAYIIPAGHVPPVGGSLAAAAIGGAPAASIVGASDRSFASETLGFTAPGGKVPAGTYDIVYNECQDGIRAPVDEVFPHAFQVTIPVTVPTLPDSQIQAIKAKARAQAQSWQELSVSATGMFQALEVLDYATEAVQDLVTGDSLATVVRSLARKWIVDQAYDRLKDYYGPDLRDVAVRQLQNAAANYARLAADPPNPDFKHLTPLGPRPPVQATRQDPLLTKGARLIGAAQNEAALSQALVISLERYQGAAAAGNGDWALIHARAIRAYAQALATQLATSDAARAALRNALAADAHPLNDDLARLEQQRKEVVANGFSPRELQAARDLGLTSADMIQARANLAAKPFNVTTAGLQNLLSAQESATSSTVASLTDLATAMDAIIASLKADPGVADEAPVASAGGPYSGAQGVPLAVGAGTSSSPSPLAASSWDLSGTGAFTGATSLTPTITYDQPFKGWAGVQVTNTAGLAAIAYAAVSVTVTNLPPQITGTVPATTTVAVGVGASQVFTVATTDPEGDPSSITWLLDGTVMATGPSFTYRAPTGALGLHTVAASVRDAGHTAGAADTHLWSVAVMYPDADGDGWTANADCNDADPSVGACPSALTPAAPPSAPLAVSATLSSTAVVVNWTAPMTDGNTPIIGYRITASDGTTLTAPAYSTVISEVVTARDGTTATVPAPATSARVPGLAGGRPYSFTVTALNVVGAGPASVPSPDVTVPGTPGTPRAVSAAATGTGREATVSWSPPASDGGSPIQSYLVSTSGGGTLTVTGPATAATVHGLTPCNVYTFTVAATTAIGQGLPSAPTAPITEPTYPGLPENLHATPGDTVVDLHWSPPASDGGTLITDYYVFQDGSYAGRVDGNTTSLRVTNLTNGAAYSFKVRAINGVGAGDYTAPVGPVVPVTLPGAPLDVQATAGDMSATVTWLPPGSTGGSLVTSYRVQGSDGSTTSVDGQTTQVVISHLLNASPYSFTVTALTSVGSSVISAPSDSVYPSSVAVPAAAQPGGNLWITGHDMDLHCNYQQAQCNYLKVATFFVRAGSSLPLLLLDHCGAYCHAYGWTLEAALRRALGSAMPAVVTLDPRRQFAGVPLVSSSGRPLYSALVVASDTTCSGCDLNELITGERTYTADSDAINARAADIAQFFNAGGGILALAGAENRAVYYSFLPIPAAAVAVTKPFTETALGLSYGALSPADNNCCHTHNSFTLPGPDSPLQLLETDSLGRAETLIARRALICGASLCRATVTAPVPREPTSTPEAASNVLFEFGALALLFLSARSRRRARTRPVRAAVSGTASRRPD